MQLHRRMGSLALGLLPWMMVCCLLTATARAQSNDNGQTSPTIQSPTNATDETAKAMAAQMQIFAELQARQQAALKELQQAQKEIAASLAVNSSNNAAQLAAFSEMMDVQRKQDLKVVRDAQRVGLAIVVGLSGVLLVSILFLNFTSIRTINRMTAMLTAPAMSPEAEAQALAEAREAQRQLLLFPGERGPHQLGSALVQLHSRIQSLENLAGKIRSETSAPDTGPSMPKPAKPGEIPATSAAR